MSPLDVQDAYVVAALRIAGGKRNQRLKGWHPVDLAAIVLDNLVRRARADTEAAEDVIFGCVTLIGEQSHNIARQAVLASGLLHPNGRHSRSGLRIIAATSDPRP